MMKQTLTAKLKLQTTPEQFQALRQTQLAYLDALDYVSRSVAGAWQDELIDQVAGSDVSRHPRPFPHAGADGLFHSPGGRSPL